MEWEHRRVWTCNKLTKFYRGKLDSSYPMFVLYNKSNVPDRIKNINKYQKVFKSLKKRVASSLKKINVSL